MKGDDETKTSIAATANPARREALIKIGKYAAYTAPAMMVTVGSARATDPTKPPPTSTPD